MARPTLQYPGLALPTLAYHPLLAAQALDYVPDHPFLAATAAAAEVALRLALFLGPFPAVVESGSF
jgi:hypothetical protein